LRLDRERIKKVFAQVRSELYFPPCEMEIKDENVGNVSPFFVSGSKIYISPKAIPKGVDEEKYLVSVMRHEVSHFHYCPYDIRTAYELVREAYDSCRNWDIAYFSLLLFTDLNVDCFYLLNKFNETPYHLGVFLNTRQSGVGKYVQSTYKFILKKIGKEYDYNVENVARQISIVMKSERNWFSKVALIALILSMSKVKIKMPTHLAGSNINIPLREDLSKNGVEKISEVLGGIRNSEEARKFYEYWIKPRLKDANLEMEITKIVKRSRRGAGGKRGGKGSGKMDRIGAETGREPKLFTSMGKPYSGLSEDIIRKTLWRVFWYEARAKRTMLLYFEEGKRPEPNLSISSYPTDWNIEDEVEELDLETSLDEGKPRIEVNMIKWENEVRGRGSNLSVASISSSLIVLDASKSMEKVFDDAATSAFINLLSAQRVGGKTASIGFSTDYYSVDWWGSMLEKELALSLYFGKMTILPLTRMMELASESENRVVVNIITDCGWQNIEEALSFLEQMVKTGHTVKIFYLRGGEYMENLKRVSRVSGIRIIPVKDPEKDLQYLVARETSRDYGPLLVFKDNQ
jgi:hypothetical protein